MDTDRFIPIKRLKSLTTRAALTFMPRKNGVVAITLHNIPIEQEYWLFDILRQIKNDYGFVRPYQVGSSCEKNSAFPSVMLTFDDGFASNRRIAETVLEPLDIKAHFFIASGFVGLNPEDARDYAQRNIYPLRKLVKTDGSTDAMSWDDVRYLAVNGHSIGAHTKSHTMLSSLNLHRKHREIVLAADDLEHRIGVPVTSFAYPFGSLKSVDRDAVEITRKRFAYAFMNIRGSLAESPGVDFLYRQNIVPGSPKWLVKAIIEGRLDWRYYQTRRIAKRQYESWSNE